MVATRVAELAATGSPATRLFQTLVDGKRGHAEVGGGGGSRGGGAGVGLAVARAVGRGVGSGVRRGTGRALATGVAVGRRVAAWVAAEALLGLGMADGTARARPSLGSTRAAPTRAPAHRPTSLEARRPGVPLPASARRRARGTSPAPTP